MGFRTYQCFRISAPTQVISLPFHSLPKETFTLKMWLLYGIGGILLQNADCSSVCPFLSKYKVKRNFMLNGFLECCSVNIQLFSTSQLCRVFIPSNKSNICCKTVCTGERKHAFQVEKCCCQPVQGLFQSIFFSFLFFLRNRVKSHTHKLPWFYHICHWQWSNYCQWKRSI